MYIFRWLMKHPLIILALYFLSIAAILYSMTGGGSSENKADTTKIVEEQKTSSADVDLAEAPAIEPSNLTSALVTGEPSTGAESSEIVASKVETENINPEEQVTAEETTEVKEQAAVEETVEVETTEAITDASSESASLESQAQFSEMETDELLLMAREAYWNNGLEESAQIYQQLISSNPDVVDYKGELGNVYWRQGFPKKAAALYAEISMPMIADGQKDKVANMVGFIGLFYPEKATEIHNTLQAEK